MKRFVATEVPGAALQLASSPRGRTGDSGQTGSICMPGQLFGLQRRNMHLAFAFVFPILLSPDPRGLCRLKRQATPLKVVRTACDPDAVEMPCVASPARFFGLWEMHAACRCALEFQFSCPMECLRLGASFAQIATSLSTGNCRLPQRRGQGQWVA